MIDFGKKVYSGNFLIMKKVKALSKKEMARLREMNGTNKEMCKKLNFTYDFNKNAWIESLL